jgi:hypothetical protein
MNKNIEDILASYKAVKGEYQAYHSYMQTLHDYYFVSSDNITRTYTFGNELDYSILWDATSVNAVQVAVAGVHSYLTPPNNRWFDFGISERRLEQNHSVRRWLNDAAEEVFYVLGRSNFDQQVDPFYATSFVYGSASMFAEEDVEDHVRFKTIPIRDMFMVEDSKERVNEYYIRHEYTCKQAVDEFGIEAVSDAVREEYVHNRYSSKKTEYTHYVSRRGEYDPRKRDKLNMPWASVWIDTVSHKTVREGGYREDPFGVHRFYKRANQVMGFSPCMDSLPFVRTLNTIVETNLVGAQTVIRPPLDVPDQGYITQFNLNPGALNIRRNNLTKDQMIKPVITGSQPQIGIEFQELYRKDIRQALFNDIFMAFSDITKQMTVPEVRERISEKMSMLGPAVGRYQTEFLGKIIHRVIAILLRKGVLPPLPDELIENPDYKINFISPLALAQKTSDIGATQDMLMMVGQMSEVFPTVLDKVNSDMVVDVVAQARGVPMEILNDDDKVAEIRESRAQMQEMQETLMAAQQGADVDGTVARTEKDRAVAQKAAKE